MCHQQAQTPLLIQISLTSTAHQPQTATRMASALAGAKNSRSQMPQKVQPPPPTLMCGEYGCTWHPTGPTTTTATDSSKARRFRPWPILRAVPQSTLGATSSHSQVLQPPSHRWQHLSLEHRLLCFDHAFKYRL
jgi:hypothetical protein